MQKPHEIIAARELGLHEECKNCTIALNELKSDKKVEELTK